MRQEERFSADGPLPAILQQLGARTSSPGGGAVCCIMAGFACGLAEMVARFSDKVLGAEELDRQLAVLKGARESFLQLAERDAKDFAALMQVYQGGLKGTERKAALRQAAADLVGLGEQVLEQLRTLDELLASLSEKHNSNLTSDLHLAKSLSSLARQGTEETLELNRGLC